MQYIRIISMSKIESELFPFVTHVKEMLLLSLFSRFSVFEYFLLNEKVERIDHESIVHISFEIIQCMSY